MSHEEHLQKLFDKFLYICKGSSTITIVGTTYSVYGDDEKVVVPAYINDLPVTEIGEKAFCALKSVKEVILPQTLKVIGESAFFDCLYLEKINFPKALVEIKECAFKLTSLKDLVFDGPIKFIGKEAFYGCADIESVYFETYRVEKIGIGAFYNCYQIKIVDIDDSNYWCETVFETKSSNPLYEGYGELLVNGQSIFRVHNCINQYALINCTIRHLILYEDSKLRPDSFNNLNIHKVIINGFVTIEGAKANELNFFKRVDSFEIKVSSDSVAVSYDRYCLPEIDNKLFFSLPLIETKLS